MVMHIYSHSTWEAEAGRPETQGHLYTESEAILGYKRPYIKILIKSIIF